MPTPLSPPSKSTRPLAFAWRSRAPSRCASSVAGAGVVRGEDVAETAPPLSPSAATGVVAAHPLEDIAATTINAASTIPDRRFIMILLLGCAPRLRGAAAGNLSPSL